MALAAQYHTWRTTENPSCLSKDAALNYVTTLVTHKGVAAIEKHASAQARQLRKKEEVVSSTESLTSLCEEIQTELQFRSSGGAYLPGLDENLVSDQTVTLPILHVVQFNTDGRIEQIRLHWDQGSLLKALGVLGTRGANWPITESEHQAKLIKESNAETADAIESAHRGTLEETTKEMGDVSIANRPTKKVNPTNDPHTSLDFAAMPEEAEPPKTGSPAKGSVGTKIGAGKNYGPNRLFEGDEDPQATPQSVAPRGTSRPQERPWNELFVEGPESNQATPKASENESPSKGRVAPKIGAGRNYAPNRLFDLQAEDADASDSASTDRTYIKPHATKFQHFDFYDGHDEVNKPSTKPAPRTKHMSQWDFADFTTPAKPMRTRGQSQGAHHFSFDDETKTDSPFKQPVHKPRRDANTHFELQDDGGDADYTSTSQSGPRVGAAGGHNRNQSSLWQSQTDDTRPDDGDAQSYTQTTVVSNKDRSKTFGAHWAMDDANPGAVDEAHDASSAARQTGIGASIKDRSKDFQAHWAIDDDHPGATDDSHDASRPQTGLSHNKSKVLQTMAPQWEVSDDTPPGKGDADADYDPFPGGKENNQPRGIKTSGDGTGGRKGTTRQWGFGDDEGDAPAHATAAGGVTATGARRPPGGHSSAAYWEHE